MPLSPGPFVKPQYFDDDGNPANAFRLFFYDAGTSTKRDTYQDADQSSLNTNPVVLDAAGRANIFLLPTLYKIVYAEPGSDDPPSSPIWTVDDVGAAGGTFSNVDVEGTAGETISLNDVCYLSDGSGALTAGRWYKTDADQTYSSNGAVTIGIATADIASGENGAFRRAGRMTGLAGLTVGAPHYVSATAGALTVTAPTNAIVVGKADSSTSLVMDPQWGLAGAAVVGLIGTGAQAFSGVKSFNSQPLVYVGTATTLPATVAGVFFTDSTQWSIPGASTDSVMSDTEIPANMLNANGKAIRLHLGSTVAFTGANTKQVELDIGGNQLLITSQTTNPAFWFANIDIQRVSTTEVDVVIVGNTSLLSDLNATSVQRVTALNFTAAIDLRILATTGAASTLSQTFFRAEVVG